jgi:hypothetical protein
VNGGRVEYVTDEGSRSAYWNIPIANTKTIAAQAQSVRLHSAHNV